MKKYLLLQNDLTISYDDEKCYSNDNILEFDDPSSLSAKAEELKNDFYNKFLKKHYKHLVVLTAAGTSLDNGKKRGETRDGLWKSCCPEIKDICIFISSNYKQSEINKKEIITNLKANSKLWKIIKEKDIEELLSYIILIEKTDSINEETIKKKRKALENKIKDKCSLELDNSAPHKNFLNKISARKNNDPRVQLFTTNYDTLFEQAAEQAGFVLIDGFSFTQPRSFSGRWFDLDIVNREKTRLKQEESFLSKVIHLYKLHGSVNWERKNERIIQNDKPDNPLIIYPASNKYESSYEQPYFEMMSRFQQALRKEETLLIVLGFGFRDKHINNVIIEAVEQNPSFQLLIVDYNENKGISKENLCDFFVKAGEWKVKRNVNIIFDTFGNFTDKYPENKTYSINTNEYETI